MTFVRLGIEMYDWVRCDFYIFEFVIVRLVVGLGLKLGLGLGIRKRVRGGKKGWMSMDAFRGDRCCKLKARVLGLIPGRRQLEVRNALVLLT